MQQHERSERSRTQILEAALRLFSRQGYRGTSIREIADAAGISTGNLYHQFPDKETIFRTLLDQYWKAIEEPDFPFNRALAEGAFPDDFEALGRAARESVRRFKPYIALIYVDVVEFEGSHIRRFYSEMAQRFQAFLDRHPEREAIRAKVRDGISPLLGVMLASRFLLYYFSVELIFGVPNHFGKDSDAVLREMADIFRHGMLRPRLRRGLAPVVWLLVGGLLGAGCRERKKLIEFGWDIPDTAFLRAHARQIDDSPFDGVVFQVQARPGGAASSLSWRAFGRQRFSEADLAQARRDLRATRLRHVRSNFLRLNTTPFDLDWFDDFSSVLGNAELAARLARAGRARGILLDTEAYEAPLFHYARQRRAAERSFEEYAAQVRRRGRELMQAFERGQPGLTLLLTFAHSLPWGWMQAQGVTLRETEYGLLAPFVDGLLEGASRGTLVDGHELSYWYREPERFAAAYQVMSQGVRPIVGDPVRYQARMGFGFGLWLDYDWRRNGWNAEDPARNYFTPDGFEAAVTAALRASDEFVWIYSETPRWWSQEGGRVKLPDAYDRALRRAKAAASEPARRLPRRPPPATAASARGGR